MVWEKVGDLMGGWFGWFEWFGRFGVRGLGVSGWFEGEWVV